MVEKLPESHISAYVLQSSKPQYIRLQDRNNLMFLDLRFLLMHQMANDESIKLFFQDVYEEFIKVILNKHNLYSIISASFLDRFF